MQLQPERRSLVRIVTLKNAGWLAISVTVLLIVVSAFTQFRARYNREHRLLYDQRIEATTRPSPLPPADTVTEAAVDGQTGASGREKFLTITPSTAPTTVTAPSVTEPIRLGGNGGGRVVISGGSEGVRVSVQPAPRRPHS